MVSKTKHHQTLPLKKSKGQKEKKQKWLILVDNAVDEYYDEYSDFDSSSFGYYRYNIQTQQSHEWVEKENFEAIKIVFQCALCGAIAIGRPRDNYLPTVYDYYMRTKEDADMSCAEYCAKDIIE